MNNKKDDINSISWKGLEMSDLPSEEELRKNLVYREAMDYLAKKMRDAEEKYGPLAKSPAHLLYESMKKLDKSLFNLRKEIDKDKKVVNISDYRS